MKAHLKLITSHKKILSLYNSGAVFCAFDTETTGVNPEKDKLLEIGAVKFTKDGIIDSFSMLINPEQPIPPYITQLTGISWQLIQNEPVQAFAVPAFRQFCQGTVLIAHNAQFDLRFVNSASKQLDLIPLQNEAIDTLRLSRILLPDNTTWKQTALAEQFKIDTGHAHRAGDDARVCMELFKIFTTLPLPKKKKNTKKADIQKASSMYASSLATQALLDN